MDKLVEYLRNWCRVFLENRDIMLKKIVSLREEENKVLAEFKDKKQAFFIYPSADKCDMSELSSAENPVIVTFNTEENLRWVLKRWDDLIKITTLSIYVVNPFSQIDIKWIVHPHTHSKICSGNSLERGLRSMADMVEPTTLQQIEKKI